MQCETERHGEIYTVRNKTARREWMRTGNLAEPVLKRSVYRQLNMEIYGIRGCYGADCVWVSPSADREKSISSGRHPCESGAYAYTVSGPVPGSECDPGIQVTELANRLAAGGAVPAFLMIQALLPQSYGETELREDMKRIAAAAREYGMEVADVQAGVSSGVHLPQYFLTGVGYEEAACTDDTYQQRILCPGQDLVLTKWIALAGTSSLASVYEKELRSKYPFSLVDRAKEFGKLTAAGEEARAITHFGACAVHHLSQGGIFNALWEMADRAGVGLEVDLKKIPVKQETIEICEYFDINPYYLYSAGALLVGTDRAEALLDCLASMGIQASVIGRVTDRNDRVIRNGGECRFLDRPKQDEWYRRMENERTDFNIS